MKPDFMNSLEDLGKSATEYADLKIDDLKLRTAKGLSVTLNKIILTILFLTIVGIIITSAAFGGIVLIGKLIGSYAGGAFIVSAFFICFAINSSSTRLSRCLSVCFLKINDMNYLDIKDLKSLDAARSELSSELVRKKAELNGRYLSAKSCFSPVALLASSVKSAALHFLPMDSLVVGMMRYFFGRRKKR